MAPETIIPIIAAIFLIALLGGGAAIAASSKPEVFGHPKGLYMLFFAEMWERFSFTACGRANLLSTQHWLSTKASLTWSRRRPQPGVHHAVLVGIARDRYLGQRKAFCSLRVLTLGHSPWRFAGTVVQSERHQHLLGALALIIVGSALSHISVMVGHLTAQGYRSTVPDTFLHRQTSAPRSSRSRRYLGRPMSGLCSARPGGVLLGLVVFVLGKKALLGHGEAPKPLARSTEWSLYAVGLAAVAVIWVLIQYQDAIQQLLVYSGTLLLGYVAIQATFKIPYGSIGQSPQGRMWVMVAGSGCC